MTKQQLREAIRRIINQELNEEMKTKSVFNPNASKWRIVNEKTGNPMTKEFYNSKEEAMDAAKALGRTNAAGIKIIQLKDTMKVYTKGLDESLTDTERDELDHIEDIIRHKGKTDSASISKKMADRYKELIAKKNKKKMSEGPAVADPETEEDVETMPYTSPDEDDLTIGNPHTKPDNIPAKAEEDILKKIIARYETSLNEKKFK